MINTSFFVPRTVPVTVAPPTTILPVESVKTVVSKKTKLTPNGKVKSYKKQRVIAQTKKKK